MSLGSRDSVPPAVPAARRGRRLGKKGVRVAVVGIVIVLAVLIGYLGSAPQPDRLPSQVIAQGSSLLGQDVRVRGIVTSWDPDNNTFFLWDTNTTGGLPVVYDDPLPHEIRTGKEAVVLGVLRGSPGNYFIEVKEIIVGHPK
jgi:cytochrome c-type biogenesis protein CcmE